MNSENLKNKISEEYEISLDNYNSLNDFLFFKYMCEEGNEKQQKTFLNALGIKTSEDFTIENQKISPDIWINKACELDFLAKDKGTIINIELQQQKTSDFNERLFYYSSRLVCGSVNKGNTYKNLEKVLTIAIINFNMDDSHKYHRIYQTIENTNLNDKFLPSNEIHVIELKKFKKIKKDWNNKKHLYFTFIGNKTSHDERKELAKMDEGLKAAFKKIELATQDEETLRKYHFIEMKKMEAENQIKHAEQKGEEKGIEKKSIELAIKLKKDGFPMEDIIKYSGLNKNQIEKL